MCTSHIVKLLSIFTVHCETVSFHITKCGVDYCPHGGTIASLLLTDTVQLFMNRALKVKIMHSIKSFQLFGNVEVVIR